jgi:hypothetical protein
MIVLTYYSRLVMIYLTLKEIICWRRCTEQTCDSINQQYRDVSGKWKGLEGHV